MKPNDRAIDAGFEASAISVAMAHTKMFNMSVAAAVVNGGSKALTIKGGGDE